MSPKVTLERTCQGQGRLFLPCIKWGRRGRGTFSQRTLRFCYQKRGSGAQEKKQPGTLHYHKQGKGRSVSKGGPERKREETGMVKVPQGHFTIPIQRSRIKLRLPRWRRHPVGPLYSFDKEIHWVFGEYPLDPNVGLRGPLCMMHCFTAPQRPAVWDHANREERLSKASPVCLPNVHGNCVVNHTALEASILEKKYFP